MRTFAECFTQPVQDLRENGVVQTHSSRFIPVIDATHNPLICVMANAGIFIDIRVLKIGNTGKQLMIIANTYREYILARCVAISLGHKSISWGRVSC